MALLAAAEAGAGNRGADGSFEKRVSSHFVLYQDVDIDRSSGLRGSRRFEKIVLDTLEDGYDRLDASFGLRPRRKLDVVVYDPQIFDATYAGMFGFAPAGFYSGTIHVRGATVVDDRLIATLNHELVHAAFDAVAPALVLPAWLNEGLAEWFEARSIGRRQLSPAQYRALSSRAASDGLFALWQLSDRSFGALGPDSARLAYLQSYAFVDYLARLEGERSLRELCRNLIRKRDLDRAIQVTFKADLAELEASFTSEYGRLGG